MMPTNQIHKVWFNGMIEEICENMVKVENRWRGEIEPICRNSNFYFNSTSNYKKNMEKSNFLLYLNFFLFEILFKVFYY